MKTMMAVATLIALICLSACQKDIYALETIPVAGAPSVPVNSQHPLRDSLQSIIQRHLGRGIPGVQVIVKTTAGWYIANGGYADIENKKPMTDNMTAWLYSITKVYTAALVMQMKERDLLALDTPMVRYLPKELIERLPNFERITVRQLLRHSSGLPNFTTTPGYFLTELNQPLQQYPLEEQLSFIEGKSALFEPGTDFSYSNSNYLLLQLILEKVSGKTWQNLIQTEILQPLGLQHTYTEVSDEQIRQLGFPNYYFERFNDGRLENCTRWNHSIAHSLEGYGGIAANGADVIRFMQALMEGEVVSQASLDEMRQWITGKESSEPDYGLGLEYYEQNYVPGVPTYGHEGDNIGGTTQILYVPSKNAYLFISINAGRQLYGQYLMRTSSLKIDLCRLVAGF